LGDVYETTIVIDFQLISAFDYHLLLVSHTAPSCCKNLKDTKYMTSKFMRRKEPNILTSRYLKEHN